MHILTGRHGWLSRLSPDPAHPDAQVLYPGNTLNIAWGCSPVGIDCRGCILGEIAPRQGVGHTWDSDQRRIADQNRWLMVAAHQRSARLAGARMRVLVSETCDIGDNHPAIVGQLPRLWDVITQAPELDWVLQTRRPEALIDRIPNQWRAGWPPHVMLAVSAGVPRLATLRLAAAQHLPGLHTLALVLEPLLAPVDLRALPRVRPDDLDGLLRAAYPDIALRAAWRDWYRDVLGSPPTLPPMLRWMVIGGEYSVGAPARGCEPDWVRRAIAAADDLSIPVFVKQLGTVASVQGGWPNDRVGQRWECWPADLRRRAWPDGTVWNPDRPPRMIRWPEDLMPEYDDKKRAKQRLINQLRRRPRWRYRPRKESP